MKPPRAPRPLDEDALRRLALRYVERYATTRAKLADYLKRKLRERGWAGDGAAPVAAVVARCVELGFVDDAAFAGMRAAALTRRGMGMRRIATALAQAGVERDTVAALAHDEDEAVAVAEAFARRKRIGPYAAEPMDDAARRRAFAAMVRAGHNFALARRYAEGAPESPD